MAAKEKELQNTPEAKHEKAIVTWQDKRVTVTFDDVKRHLCPKASDQEIIVFLKMAQSLNLNPWAREIYMVKYKDDEAASYIIASEAYLKAAEQCPEYDGHEAGILVCDAANNIEEKPGTFLMDQDKTKVAGGWARVYRKDRQRPFYIAVNFKECAKYTREGKLTRFWASMPATMIRKVALARALREAFPTRLGSMIADAEYQEVGGDLAEEYQPTVPPALEKNGKPNWKMFYAKIKKDLGLSPDQAHQLSGLHSFSQTWDEGWSMENIWDAVVEALRKRNATEPEQIVDTETGEIITEEEGIFGESEEEAGIVAPAEAEVEQPAGASAPAQLKRDPESIKDNLQLGRACYEDFKIQPGQVAKELGYSNIKDVKEDPAECYRRIAAVWG